MVKTYTRSLLNDKSGPDGRSYSLYWVPTLTANFYNLHWTLALMTNRRYRDIKMNQPEGKLRKLSGHSANCQLRVLTFNPSEYKNMLRLLIEGSRWRVGLGQLSGHSNNC